MGKPEKQFGDTFTPYRNAGGFFTVSSRQFKRIIASFISLVTILLSLSQTSVFSESFFSFNANDINGFNPETNSSFSYSGINFELPDYYKKFSFDSQPDKSAFFADNLINKAFQLAFFEENSVIAQNPELYIDIYIQSGYKASDDNKISYSSYNMTINGIDLYLVFPEKGLLEEFYTIYTFLITENSSNSVILVFLQSKSSQVNYYQDFIKVLWTATPTNSSIPPLTPYPAENFLDLPLQNITSLQSESYHSAEKESTLSGMIFYVDGVVTSVGTWEDTCKSIKVTSDIENKDGTFVTIQNDLGYAIFSEPTESNITLPTEGSNVRFYGQYIGYDEDVGAAILDINPDYDIMPEGNKQPKPEITFRNIPWGTSYPDATSAIPEIAFAPFHGEIFKTYSVDQIITGKGITFEYTDINISASSIASSISVAGYETSKVELFFAYTPKNGILTKKEEDTALYGAMYEFEPVNTESMSKDLLQKLSSVYGEPDSTSYDSNIFGGITKYTYWSGANNTLLVLCVQDESNSSWKSSEKVRIIYAWRDGDELLQQASDCLKEEAIRSEESKYGNGNVNGL